VKSKKKYTVYSGQGQQSRDFEKLGQRTCMCKVSVVSRTKSNNIICTQTVSKVYYGLFTGNE